MGGIMKKTIFVLIALSILLVMVGCDPFGSSETMTYITGTVYVDAAMTTPAEGVGVELLVEEDSSAVRTQTVFTNAAGVFFMEAQFYPNLPDDETGTGYSIPSTAKVGLIAHYNDMTYTYATLDSYFILSAGDTLTVWSVSLSEFIDPSGGNQ